MMLRWIAARAKNEVDHISRRMKEGHRRRKEQGRVPAGGRGGRAFGFAVDGLGHVEGECEVVREMTRRVLAGEKMGALVRDLTARGVCTPAGGPFSHGGLKKMLMRPRYAGLLPDGATPAAWEPTFDTDRDKAREIWERFPKFIIGFIVTFAAGLYLALATPADIAAKVPAAIGEANTFRVIFFILTFFSIGVLSNFKRLWAEGIGKLAAVYFVSLFGFVIWVGLLISWLFFAGIKPPLAS